MQGGFRHGLLARFVALTAITASAGACGGDTRDLREYVDGVKARPGGRIEPLPEIRPAPTFVYEPGGRRSPFMPDSLPDTVSVDPGAGRGLDPIRPRELLERFPLDTLRMVGTLEARGRSFGLVQTADGLIHRITVGNRMGRNDGLIVSITDSAIALVETVSDGRGGYLDRPAAIRLSD